MMMMGLNVLKEVQAAVAGDWQGLVVTASGSHRGELHVLGIQRVGIFLWAHPAAPRVVSRGEQAAWGVSRRCVGCWGCGEQRSAGLPVILEGFPTLIVLSLN